MPEWGEMVVFHYHTHCTGSKTEVQKSKKVVQIQEVSGSEIRNQIALHPRGLE